MSPKPKVIVIDYPPLTTRKWKPPHKPHVPQPFKRKPISRLPEYPHNRKIPHSTLEKIWHQFKIFSKNSAILLGHYSQYDSRFPLKVRGKQGPATCFVAIGYSMFKSMPNWDANSIHAILEIGTRLYVTSVGLNQNMCSCTSPKEVRDTFYIENKEVLLAVHEDEYRGALFDDCDEPFFQNVLRKGFKNAYHCVVEIEGKFMAIWKQGGSYYIFDPNDRDYGGNRVTEGHGIAVVLKFVELSRLVEHCQITLAPSQEKLAFQMWSISVKKFAKSNLSPPNSLDELVTIPPKVSTKLPPKTCLASKLVGKINPKTNEIPGPPGTKPKTGPRKSSNLENPPGEADNKSNTPSISHLTDATKVNERPEVIPLDKPRQPSVTYFHPIVPDRSGIIRGTCSQASDKCTQFLGKQSLANAIAAIGMLRCYRSKLWYHKMVDEILLTGETIYIESRKNFVGDQELNLRNIVPTFTINKKLYKHDIEEITIVGQFGSDKNVLDLRSALAEIFIDNDAAIIRGPLIIAVWAECGKYYMFDPNERNERGQVVEKYYSFSNPNLLISQPGVACVTWFVNLDDLTNLYMSNLPRGTKRDPFYISKIEVNEFFGLADPWKNFTPLSLRKWILRGTFSQNNARFENSARNAQCTAMSTMSIIFSRMSKVAEWDRATVDEIVMEGDRYYGLTVAELKETQRFRHKYLTLNECLRKYTYKDRQVNINIEECKVFGLLISSPNDSILGLRSGFTEFFKEDEAGVLTSRRISVAFWKEDDYYYYFDSHSRDEQGFRAAGGNACVLRFASLDDMTNMMLGNFSAGNEDVYNIGAVNILISDTTEDGVVIGDFHEYTSISKRKGIIRSRTHQGDFELFDANADKQTIPNMLSAIAMTTILPCEEWTQDLMDKILKYGNKYYEDSRLEIITKDLLNFGNWDKEQKVMNADLITAQNVMKEMFIGVNKIKFDIKEAVPGIFEPEKRKYDEEGEIIYEPNELRTILNKALHLTEDKSIQAFLIDCEQISLAIWKYNDLYFIFDPRGKNSRGNFFGRDLWSAKVIVVDEEEMNEAFIEDSKLVRKPKEDEKTSSSSAEKLGVEEGEEEEYVGEAFEPEDISDAKACTIMLASFEEVLNHIIENVRPNKRLETFKLYPIAFVSAPQLKESGSPQNREMANWYDFKEVEKDVWIIRGDMNLRNDYFPKPNRGKQYGSMCVVACVYGRLYSLIKFKPITVDSIMKHGDRLHTVVRQQREKVLLDNRKQSGLSEQEIFEIAASLEITASETPQEFLLGNYHVTVTIEKNVQIGDITIIEKAKEKAAPPPVAPVQKESEKKAKKKRDSLTSRRSQRSVRSIRSRRSVRAAAPEFAEEEQNQTNTGEPPLKVTGLRKGFKDFFEKHKFGILHTKNISIAIFKIQEFVYMFDPDARGPSGIRQENGTACLMRFADSDRMATIIEYNMKKEDSNAYSIDAVNIKSKPAIRPAAAVPDVLPLKPKMTTFHQIDADKHILRGSFHQDNPKFNVQPQATSSTNAIVAITMTKLHPPEIWTRPIIDDLMMNALKLYKLSAEVLGFKFNEWEDKMTVDKIVNEFKVGVNNINWGINSDGIRRGILNIKSPDIPNLRQCCEKFFAEYNQGVIESPKLTTGVWQNKGLFYMFDPNSRGTTGLYSSAGTSCLLLFRRVKDLVTHFLANVPVSAQKDEFVISPVNIVTYEVTDTGVIKPPPPIKKQDILKIKDIDSLASYEVDDTKKAKKKKKPEEITCDKSKKTPIKAEPSKKDLPPKNTKAKSTKDPCCCPDKNKLIPQKNIVINENQFSMATKKELIRAKSEARRFKEFQRNEHRLREVLYDLGNGVSIVRAHYSQNCDKYGVFSRNKQTHANALVAIVMSKLHDPNTWSYKNIEIILDSGDVLYKDSYMKYRPKNPMLGLKNLLRTFYIIHMKISIIIYKPYIFGDCRYEDLYVGLLNFFMQETAGILVLDREDSLAIAVFQRNGQYFMFDPYGRDVRGDRTEGEGCACLLRFSNIENLVEKFLFNGQIDLDAETVPRFSVCAVCIESVEKNDK